jgi:hypothetical protein
MTCTRRNHAAVLPTILATTATVLFLVWCVGTAADRTANEREQTACQSVAELVGLVPSSVCASEWTDETGMVHPASFPVVTECARLNRNDVRLTRACVEITLGGGVQPDRVTPDAPVRPVTINAARVEEAR